MHPIVQRRAVNFKSRVFFHTSTAFSHQLHYMPERPPYEVSSSNKIQWSERIFQGASKFEAILEAVRKSTKSLSWQNNQLDLNKL